MALGRPNLDAQKRARAWAYWDAKMDGKPNKDALLAAQSLFPKLRKVSAETIRRYARDYRDLTLDAEDSAAMWDDRPPRAPKLHEHLKKMGKRGRYL